MEILLGHARCPPSVQIVSPMVAATDLSENHGCVIAGGAVHSDHFPHQCFHMSSCMCRLHYTPQPQALIFTHTLIPTDALWSPINCASQLGLQHVFHTQATPYPRRQVDFALHKICAPHVLVYVPTRRLLGPLAQLDTGSPKHRTKLSWEGQWQGTAKLYCGALLSTAQNEYKDRICAC